MLSTNVYYREHGHDGEGEKLFYQVCPFDNRCQNGLIFYGEVFIRYMCLDTLCYHANKI